MSVTNPTPEWLAEDVRSDTIVVCGVMMGLSIATFVMRIGSRHIKGGSFMLSDYLALAGLVSSLVISIIVLNNARLGVGLHVNRVSFGNIRTIMLTSWIGQLFYGIGFTVIKLSILRLYQQIFPSQLVNIGSYVLGAASLMWGIAYILVAIFECDPVQGYWDFTIQSRCLSQLDFYIGFAVPNMVIDLAMMLLPIRNIWELQLPSRVKLGIVGIFALAGLVIIASGLRIHFLLTMDPMDVTFTYVGAAVWSAVEINVAVMCCCLPTVRPVVNWIIGSVAKLVSTNRFTRSSSSKWTRTDDAESGFGSGYPSKIHSHNSRERETDTYNLTDTSIRV
ncbi:hypothetical protein B0I35DRAFT_215000 [Stachybotrys elegans]|uniref:Rhodopsin domain-containing protein n=1 Tax=Stachybotrys elegans TaxID=80388 RepID=A0A8K0STB3_9HYPO|nr:hypothetical protein B0I35DRAFT_215000 [Stachybotrys elegans]